MSDDNHVQYVVMSVSSVASGNTTHHLVRSATLTPAFYSKGVASRTQLMLSGDIEMNPGPGTGEECSCDQWLH